LAVFGSPSSPRPSGRIANVSGVVWVEQDDTGDVAPCAALLEHCFEEVHVARDESGADGPWSALERLVVVLAAATSDRVLIMSACPPEPPISLILALTAWPEHDAVVARRGSQPEPLRGIYRRAVVHDAARVALADGVASLGALLERVDTAYIADSDLAAIDPPG
jgi:molybdopterin-guanine dinucleotide biosynthesis protein A